MVTWMTRSRARRGRGTAQTRRLRTMQTSTAVCRLVIFLRTREGTILNGDHRAANEGDCHRVEDDEELKVELVRVEALDERSVSMCRRGGGVWNGAGSRA